MIGKLTTTLVECKNLAASERFYVEKLGLKVTSRGEGWLCADAGGASIVLCQGTQPTVVMGFEGADLPAVRQALEAKGVPVGSLEEHPGGQHYNVFDPDGNKVMISDH